MIFVIPTGVAVLWLIRVRRTPLEYAAKPLASIGFLAVGLSSGALETSFGQIVLVGLLLGAAGDLALISDKWFLPGVALFAGGHIAYIVAFSQRSESHPIVWLVALVIAALSARWLLPAISSPMRPAIGLYILIIAAMIGVALGVSPGWMIPTGAGLFAASDLFVARERFIVSDARNTLWGLPMYYAGQVLIALSVGN